MLSERQITILEGRGLDPEILVQNGVDGCPDRGPEWIRIEHKEAGRKVNTHFRTISGEKKFSQEAGGKRIFWNVDCLLDHTLNSQPLIITEGQLDALSAIQAGFQRTMSVPDGAPAAEVGDKETSKYSYLECAAGLNDVQEIILATDDDTPGHNLLNDLAARLGKARCKWARYPKGCKDLNDALRIFGARGVVESLNRAQWVQVRGVARMSELPPLKDQPVFDTGIPGLWGHFRLRLGDLSIILGTPGSGKTAFINAISAHLALKEGWTIGCASFEQRTQIDHRRNLRTIHSGRRVNEMTVDEIAAADRWIDERFAFMVPEVEDDVTLEYMLERIQVAVLRYGAKLITIDPINEMDHQRPPDMSETDYTGFMLKTFKRMAFRMQIHIMIAVHPAKMLRNRDGSYPIPSMYDASGSAHYYNKSDAGIIVHRPDNEKTLIRVQKTKYHDVMGTPGDTEVKFNIATGRYEPLETNWAASPYQD